MNKISTLIISSLVVFSYDAYAEVSGRRNDVPLSDEDGSWTKLAFFAACIVAYFIYEKWQSDKKYKKYCKENDIPSSSTSTNQLNTDQHGMPIAVIYIAALMLVVGAAPLPYGYYTLMKIIACGVFAWAAIVAYKNKFGALPWLCGIGAITFNPVIPIYLPKETWMFIDVASGLFLYLNRGSLQGSKHKDNEAGNLQKRPSSTNKTDTEKQTSSPPTKLNDIDDHSLIEGFEIGFHDTDIIKALELCNDHIKTDERLVDFYLDDLTPFIARPAFEDISKDYREQHLTGWGGLARYCEITIATAMFCESSAEIDEYETEKAQMHGVHASILIRTIMQLTKGHDMFPEDTNTLLSVGPIGSAYLSTQS